MHGSRALNASGAAIQAILRGVTSIRQTVGRAVDEAIRRGGSVERGLLAGALEYALDQPEGNSQP